MTTFDEILPKLRALFQQRKAELAQFLPILINRDLNGRVRLILDEKWENDEQAGKILAEVAREIHEAIAPHSYSPEQALLFESEFEEFLKGESTFPLEDVEGVHVVDRLAVEGDWASITPPTTGVPRVVFFSIKGGVGRSTALAATAWSLAEKGLRVLVLDLDLESPGLSSSLLPEDRRPPHGITDWLVEDLVDNGDAVFDDMVATSELSHNGEIFVASAHGADPGEYVVKLGRVWMPKVSHDGSREAWHRRLHRLLNGLEERWKPDVTLMDSRAGIDEVASACITELGASLILLFAIDGDQTWTGYRMLFRHWRTAGVVQRIRERLQVVGAMIPETGKLEYRKGLREQAWTVLSEEIYDEVLPGAIVDEENYWSYDEADEGAPHSPWDVQWNRGFAVLRSLHGRLDGINEEDVRSVFGSLLDGIMSEVQVMRGDL